MYEGHYLRRKHGIFHWRRRVPIHLVVVIGRRELVRSLCTPDRRLAVIRARRLSTITDSVFLTLEEGRVVDRAKLDELLRLDFAEMLRDDEEQRAGARQGKPVYSLAPTDEDQEPIDADLEILGFLFSDAHEALSTNRIQGVASDAGRILKAAGSDPEQEPEALQYAARGLLRAQIEVLRQAMARRVGDYTLPIADPLFIAPSTVGQTAVAAVAVNEGPRLAAVIPQHIEWRKKQGDGLAHAIHQANGTLEEFLGLHGDVPVLEINRSHLILYRDAVRALPAKHGQLSGWRELEFAEKLAKIEADEWPEGQAPISDKTLKRKFSELAKFFDWVRDYALGSKGGSYVNAAHGFKWPKGKAAREQGTAFEPHELEQLFTLPIWKGSHRYFRNQPGPHLIKDSQYWLPIIALYSGMRLNEIAQLYTHDVTSKNGIWYFDVRTEEGLDKRLKTDAATRIVPIHDELVRLGLVEYVEEAKKRQQRRLWPELQPGGLEKTYGYSAGRQFQNTRTAAGLTRPMLRFHSFRRTFATALHNAGVAEEVASALLGHENKSITFNRYSSGLTNLSLLKSAVDKVDFRSITQRIRA